MNYYSNKDNQFLVNKPREFNSLIDDPCDRQQRQTSNMKKLKFMTTNFRDLVDAVDKRNIFSIQLIDDKFVPSDKIDKDSDLRQSCLTQYNCKNGMGMLPVQVGTRYQLFHGDINTEDRIRNTFLTTNKSCNPKDTNYFERSFSIFDDSQNIPIPNAMMSVETKEKGFNTQRSGTSTRFSYVSPVEQRKRELPNILRSLSVFNPSPRIDNRSQVVQYTE
jgi:hypothetical protein